MCVDICICGCIYVYVYIYIYTQNVQVLTHLCAGTNVCWINIYIRERTDTQTHRQGMRRIMTAFVSCMCVFVCHDFKEMMCARVCVKLSGAGMTMCARMYVCACVIVLWLRVSKRARLSVCVYVIFFSATALRRWNVSDTLSCGFRMAARRSCALVLVIVPNAYTCALVRCGECSWSAGMCVRPCVHMCMFVCTFRQLSYVPACVLVCMWVGSRWCLLKVRAHVWVRLVRG